MLVHFVSGLFVATFDRLSNQPTGFSTERLLTLDTAVKGKQPAVYWDQVAEHVRSLSGVEAVALCNWPLMIGYSWSSDVWVDGRHTGIDSPYFLAVSPGWMDTMRIPFIDGRDFRAEDVQPEVAIVNETFAKRYLDGKNPVGKSVEIMPGRKRTALQIVGYVRDARYRNVREAYPTGCVRPLQQEGGRGRWPVAYERRNLDCAHGRPQSARDGPDAAAGSITGTLPVQGEQYPTQSELVQRHTVRDRGTTAPVPNPPPPAPKPAAAPQQ